VNRAELEPAVREGIASAALRDTRNAEIQNYLGYAYLMIG